MTQAYLLIIAIGLVPIALSYGANPAGVLPRLLKFNVEAPNETQVFRAIMCLYLATSVFWLMGALMPEWQRAALTWAVFFMLSLAAGRLLSMALDGMPTANVLNLYLAVELGAGALGFWLLCGTS
jgi:low temperature requirement protein LtrA